MSACLYLYTAVQSESKKKSPSEFWIDSAKGQYFYFKFLVLVDKIFWHAGTKFHVKIILRLKVMKVLVKSWKTTSEQAC